MDRTNACLVVGAAELFTIAALETVHIAKCGYLFCFSCTPLNGAMTMSKPATEMNLYYYDAVQALQVKFISDITIDPVTMDFVIPKLGRLVYNVVKFAPFSHSISPSIGIEIYDLRSQHNNYYEWDFAWDI